MIEPGRRHATYDEILGLPENLVGEILGGQLHTHPRPAPRHARTYSSLGGNLGGAYDRGAGGPGGWWIPARTLEVYRLQDDGHWLLLATLKDDDPVSQPPFDAITFPLATLWA